jgi:hypothetical protein
VTWDGCTLLYGGIAPKAPPANGRPASRQTLRKRIRYHYTGNAAGSTLRLTLGCLLAERLGMQLRRVGSHRRLTFAAGEGKLSAWMADHANHRLVIGQGEELICTTRRGATVAGPIPESTMRAGLTGGVPSQGTFLRIADLRSQPAYISMVACRSTMPRRVVPTRPHGHHQPRSAASTPASISRFPRGPRCCPLP